MIYLDSSIVLAELLVEDRRPPATLWDELSVSSALLRYEVWSRINARGLASLRGDDVHLLLSRIALFDLRADILERALHLFPVPVRTLDSLHLATVDYLRSQGRHIVLASYDLRLLAAAESLGIEAAPI
ncbi:MAG TPA: hypothetical protein VET89_00580 [Stellaceae bacterium]|nr:hypothetical protein [Stellaceae bacterium]